MAVLLTVFAVSIGFATFIENDFGTESARKLIYNAKWFELLLFVSCINIIAVIIAKKMYKKEKLTLLVFHIAFIVIIAGAGITRYFGREGSMHIREGEETSTWMTTQTYLGLYIDDHNTVAKKNYPVLLAPASKNVFRAKMKHAGHKIKLKITDYIPNAERFLLADPEGQPYIHLISSSGQGRQNIMLSQGQQLKTPEFILSFVEKIDTLSETGVVQITSQEGILYFYADFPVTRLAMEAQSKEILEGKSIHPFIPSMLHYFSETPFVLKQYLPSARVDAQASSLETDVPVSAIRLKVSCDGIAKSTVVFGNKNQIGQYSLLNINELDIALNYGPQLKKLPFKIRLNDFILKRYPGSESPSWFESNVQVIDEGKNINSEERVYMNHILKHRGYRFYQSSYDQDEKGTVLSLNRDSAGTSVTYLGYLLMTLGMLLSLLNRKSRFIKLAKQKEIISGIPKLILLGFLLSFLTPAKGQENSFPKETIIIPEAKAAEFGKLLVQDNGGRIEPVNTLASEVLRKVSRKEEYKGQNSLQVLTGMIVFPEYWKHEPMIKVSHTEIQEVLNIESNYASYLDFFAADNYGGYSLKSYIEEAYRKKPAYRSKFDNELIRVDERLNIVHLIYAGAVFRMFPDPNDPNHTWHSPMSVPEFFTKKDSVFGSKILDYYAEAVRESLLSENWKNTDEIVNAINIFQSKYGEEVIPPASRMKAEAFYNNSNLFKHVTRIYLLIGFLLLLFQFIHIFFQRFSIRGFYKVSFIFILAAFSMHTLALGLRWYVAGHAPWSNGYEALTFISWSAVLAGVIFSKKSQIALSSTAILAALILQTAHLSWMDPQITNLVPVLQSYWLVIHVAVITMSYGFLGLGALVAVVNLLLMFFQNQKIYERLEMQINQLSSVIEMTLIAGIYLLAIGTFLGGVWANESWGRYWAWDPKETWALVTLIAYAIILHLRLVPGLKGRVLFNATALIGFGTVLMTYFGVNYYLSGLHSYAKGEAIPIPPMVYYTVAIVIILSLLAAYNQFRLKKNNT